MIDFFEYQLAGESHFFYKPSNWTISIVSNIQPKFEINKTELAKYILYYSQKNYKKKNYLKYSFFESLDLISLNKLFCSYINSDIKLLQKNLKKIIDIQSGVELVITNVKSHSKKMSAVLTLGYLSIEVNQVWLDAIEGKFNLTNSERLLERWFKFRDNVIPQLQFDVEVKKQAQDINEFIEHRAETFLKYAEIISIFINSLELSKLWIPARLTRRISKEFLKFEPKNINLQYLPNLIINIVYEECLEKMKTDILSNKLLSDRSDIINEMFKDLTNNSYHSLISLGLSQIDYLVFEIVSSFKKSINISYTNTKVIDMLLDKLEEIKGHTTINKFMPFDEDFAEGLKIIQFITLTNYLNNHLFKKYDFDKYNNNTKYLNRHGVLHGKIYDYGTFENAIRIIILIDDLLYIFDHYIELNKNLYE